jgi:integral membrane protein
MNTVRALRNAGLLEGMSLLALLLVAMPLKYAFAYPQAVRLTGSIHGLLFLWFLLALFRAGAYTKD